MRVHRWRDAEAERMNEFITRQAIHTESMTMARLTLAKGAVVPEHQHENEQVSTIEKGSLRFRIDGQEIVLSAGESLVIPPNVPHSAVADEDCIAVDVFSPARKDWIRGDDAYLRR